MREVNIKQFNAPIQFNAPRGPGDKKINFFWAVGSITIKSARLPYRVPELSAH